MKLTPEQQREVAANLRRRAALAQNQEDSRACSTTRRSWKAWRTYKNTGPRKRKQLSDVD